MKPRVKALLKQINSGQLQTDMARILSHIKMHPFTTLPEVKRKLALSHQTASARISDLLDMGLIEEKGEKKNNIGTYTYFKFQPNISIQLLNAETRRKEKYKHWVKKGLTKFNDFINPELRKELLSN